MIDLTNREKSYEIKMWDGQILHLFYPTWGSVNRLIALQEKLEKIKNSINLSIDISDISTQIFELLSEVMNRNREGRAVTTEELMDKLDLETAMFIITDYFNVISNAIKK